MTIAPAVPKQSLSLSMGLRILWRHFPYTEMLAVFMPIYAFAYNAKGFRVPQVLLLLVPFIFAFAAGFTYNDIADTADDPYVKTNPLVRQQITRRQAQIALVASLIISFASFYLQYRDIVARIVFPIYIFLCLAYSGLGIRFKETYFGPAVASFIIWTGGPLILAIEFDMLSWELWGFVSGVWLIYTAREIHHMVGDYNCDRESGYRTFAVRLGVLRARYTENVLFVAGGSMLVISALGLMRPVSPPSWGILGLFAILILAACLHVFGNPPSIARETRGGYWLVRLFFVALATASLQLDPAVAVLVLWAFVISHRS